MRIKELYQAKKPVLSMEIFPPKPDYPLETVFQTIAGLKDLQPDFISVTYGAGGSNRGRTIEIAAQVKRVYGVESLAHLTCVGHSPAELDQIIAQLKQEGIENVLALRGDQPRNQPDFTFQPGHYRYAIELIQHLKAQADFCIGAAAYPEGHSECARWQQDWEYLRHKVAAGVDFLLTQLYFDNRVFYNFMDNLERLGIKVPVSAGIMPVLNANQIRRMVYLSGASIPPQLLKILEEYGDDNEAFEKAGIEYAIRQIDDLLDNGVAGIHFCTMNRVEQTRQIISNSKLARRVFN